MSAIIKVDNLTKDYGDRRGVFGLNFEIQKGEMVGFAGTNGSGKTTTIRHIMGFLQPTSGHVYVKGLEAWTHSSEYVKDIGYVPGEIAFPDLHTGTEFLKSQADFLGLRDMSYAEALIKKLQLDPRAPLKRMSKGMKQKTAIVAALMANPSILILDEPTTGLDPLMRDAFLEIITEEHKNGKTIFMSSHMFGELERTCDRVALISGGEIKNIVDMETLRNPVRRYYKIEFESSAEYEAFRKAGFTVTRDQLKYNQVTIAIDAGGLNELFSLLKKYRVRFISEVKYDLEKYFRENLSNEKEQTENVQ